MSYTITYDPASETYDDKIARLSGTSVSSQILSHWGLAAGTDVGQYFNSINLACNDIIANYSPVDAVDGSGILRRTFPSQSDADSANAAVVAYLANLTTANISVTVGANTFVQSVSFTDYMDHFYGNANVSLVS